MVETAQTGLSEELAEVEASDVKTSDRSVD